MRTGLLPVLLLPLALVAGCMDDGPGGPAAPQTYPWGISDCAFVIARVAVPAVAVEPLLPAGFRAAPTQLEGVPGAPAAELHLDAYACAGGIGLHGENLTSVAYGSLYVPVVAPEALREPGYDAYFVKLDTLVAEPERRDVLAEGGLPVHAGSVAVTESNGQWHAELVLGESGGFTFDGFAPPASPSPGALPFIEYTPLSGGAGVARWHARLHDAALAEGAGLLQPTGLARDIIGQDVVPAQFLAGVWNLDEADVTFPIAWP